MKLIGVHSCLFVVKKHMTLTYCGNIVRQQDSDRFLLSLFAPVKHRAALWTLYAFNHEIAKTREIVSDTTIGLIRLQWWRDAIKEIYEGSKPRQHEVVEPLSQVIKQYNLPRELFDKLIYAREFDLEDVPPADLNGLLNYCEYTNAPLMQLSLKILGQDYNDTMVVDISKRYALVGVIRAVPYMLSRRQNMLPQDILDKNNLTSQKLFDFKGKSKLPDIIKEILNAEKDFRYDNCGYSTPRFLKKMLKMTALYEAQIKKVDYDLFDPKMNMTPKCMALRLWLG